MLAFRNDSFFQQSHFTISCREPMSLAVAPLAFEMRGPPVFKWTELCARMHDRRKSLKNVQLLYAYRGGRRVMMWVCTMRKFE